jgi:hypothetical protein
VSSAFPPQPGRDPGFAPQPGYGTPGDAGFNGPPAGGASAAPVGRPQHAQYDDGGTTPATGTESTSGHRDVGDVSLGALMGNVTRDLSTLMRQELALAQAELKQEVSKTAKGAGAMAGAGFAGYFVLLFLSIALWSALSNVMDAGWAGLLVALLWAIIAAVLFVVGRGQLRRVNPKPERTVDTLSQVPDALKGNAGTPHRGGHQ